MSWTPTTMQIFVEIGVGINGCCHNAPYGWRHYVGSYKSSK